MFFFKGRPNTGLVFFFSNMAETWHGWVKGVTMWSSLPVVSVLAGIAVVVVMMTHHHLP